MSAKLGYHPQTPVQSSVFVTSVESLTPVALACARRLPLNQYYLIICSLFLVPSVCCIQLFSPVSLLICNLFDLDHFCFVCAAPARPGVCKTF